MPKSIPSTAPYFLFTFLWSWAFWWPIALWGPDTTHFITRLCFGLGGLGPLIFGLYFTYREKGKAGLKDVWQRTADWKRLKGWGWLIGFLLIPFLTLAAGWIDRLWEGPGLRWDSHTWDYFTRLLPPPLALAGFLIFLFLFGPLPEEIGWRGYALDRLWARWGPWGASLILGGSWGLWHLPLFFLKGAHQEIVGAGTPGFYLFFAGIVAFAVIMTWIYALTGRSILSAILMHFSVNWVGTLTTYSDRVELIRVLFCWTWAILILLSWQKTNRNRKS